MGSLHGTAHGRHRRAPGPGSAVQGPRAPVRAQLPLRDPLPSGLGRRPAARRAGRVSARRSGPLPTPGQGAGLCRWTMRCRHLRAALSGARSTSIPISMSSCSTGSTWPPSRAHAVSSRRPDSQMKTCSASSRPPPAASSACASAEVCSTTAPSIPTRWSNPCWRRSPPPPSRGRSPPASVPDAACVDASPIRRTASVPAPCAMPQGASPCTRPPASRPMIDDDSRGSVATSYGHPSPPDACASSATTPWCSH